MVRRYVAYISPVNFNNDWNAIYEALFDSGSFGVAAIGESEKAFFTNPSLGEKSCLEQVPSLDPFLSQQVESVTIAGAVSGIASGILGVLANARNIATDPVADKRFNELSTIDKFIKSSQSPSRRG